MVKSNSKRAGRRKNLRPGAAGDRRRRPGDERYQGAEGEPRRGAGCGRKLQGRAAIRPNGRETAKCRHRNWETQADFPFLTGPTVAARSMAA